MSKKNVIIEKANSIIKLELEEIIYIEKVGRKALVVTENEKITWYRTVEQLKDAVDEIFLSCHRSYLLNMDKIVRMEDQAIWMEGGHVVFFGRESYRKALRIFREYIDSEKNKENDD